jgi:CxxC-x17-CxxC domain-containing protein
MSETNFANKGAAGAATQETFDGLSDTPIACIDCREDFIWTAGEQAFFLEKNLLNPPKRCKDCKRAKNRRLAAIEMAQATGKPHKIEVNAECAQCGEKTTVPFYPSQGRPVYCRTCFDANKGKASNGNS